MTASATAPPVLAVRAMTREVEGLHAQLVQANAAVRELGVQLRQLRALLRQGGLGQHRHTHRRPSDPLPDYEPDLLRRRREALGLGQRAVALVCGYSRGAVADAETGRRNSATLVAAVTKALDALEAAA